MDLSSLAARGKVAGVASIAIGMIVLLVRPIIERTSSLPVAERAPTLRLLALGAFGVGALGIVAWIAGNSASVSMNAGPCGVVTGGGTASGNTINCTNLPPNAAGKP
jgi:hypothetical protein